MAQIESIKKIDVTSLGSDVTINLTSPVKNYKIYGTQALTKDLYIVPNPGDEPVEGMLISFDYSATLTDGDKYSFVIFGVALPDDLMSLKCKIFCEYLGTAWNVYIIPSSDADGNIDAKRLASTVVDDSTLAQDVTTKALKVKAAGITATQLAANAVESAKLKDASVTLAKLYDITRGHIIVGGADDIPSLLNAKTSGYILVGDGTDIKAVAVSGDVAISSAGVVAIGPSKILSSMIAALQISNSHIAAAAEIAHTKMAPLTPSVVPVFDSNGFIIAGSLSAANLAYLNVTPGTAEASKALVLNAYKKINELDVTTLKIGGISVVATATELNYLSGALSNLQDQISTLQTKVTQPVEVICTDEITTVTTLKNYYPVDTTGKNVAITLPAIATLSSANDGQVVEVYQGNGSNNTVVAAFSGDSIDTGASEEGSITLSAAGDWIRLNYCHAKGIWRLMSFNVTTPF
jgi:hypothetical protein